MFSTLPGPRQLRMRRRRAELQSAWKDFVKIASGTCGWLQNPLKPEIDGCTL